MVDKPFARVYSLDLAMETTRQRLFRGGSSGILAGMPNGSDPFDDMVTPAEAAELLGTSTRRVYDFIHDGRIESKQFGRNYLIKRASLENVRERPPGYPKGRPRSSE